MDENLQMASSRVQFQEQVAQKVNVPGPVAGACGGWVVLLVVAGDFDGCLMLFDC